MPRVNPQVQQLEWVILTLRDQIKRMQQDPGDMPDIGCGDSACVAAKATGMHTNGGCRCDERALRRAVQWWRRVAEFRQVTIQEMREGGVDGNT